jgi:tetratricopeptide (TPR) repeat protein
MGFLDRIFKKDPGEQLERARRLLQDGEALRALGIVSRLAEEEWTQAAAARELLGEARAQVISNARERARQAEADGYPEDALEWLEGAMEHATATEQEALEREMERLHGALEARAEEEYEPEPEVEEPEEAPFELDAEGYFDTLLGTLSDRVVKQYAQRSPEFREAFVALNGGDPRGAQAILNQLVEREPEDPIVRFERGRCHLMLGDHEAAQQDFEAAWKRLGNEPLDLNGQLSVPLLWAETLLVQNRPWPVIERLEEAAQPESGNPELTSHYAEALLQAEAWERARDFLMGAVSHFPGQTRFSFFLATALHRLDQREVAIDCLEAAIAPSCATGNCNRPPMHLPAMRLLTELHLETGELERARELIDLAVIGQRGERQGADYALLARYHEARGESEEAQRAAAEAQRLRMLEAQAGAEGESSAPDFGQQQAAL